MPAIPQYDQRTGVSGAGLGPGPTGAGRGISAVGEALQTVADNSLQLKVDSIKNSWQLADTTARTLGELEQFRQSLAADDDYDNHAPQYTAKAQEIEQRTKQAMGNNSMLYGIWRQDFRRAAQSGGVQVAVDAQKLKTGKVRAELENTLLDLSALTGTDPQVDDIVRNQARIAINANAAAGNLDFSERNTLINKFDADATGAVIRRDMLADPEVAEQKLAEGRYLHLSGEQQAVWAQRIFQAAESKQRRLLAGEDRAQRLSDHQMKLAGDAAAKNGDRLLSQGQLTPDWIEQNRNTLDPSDYRYFYKALSGSGDAPRNPMIYADLRDRAGRGEDMRDSARESLRRGQIGVGDYDRVVGEVEQQRPGWYKRGSEFISTSSAVSQLNPDPAAAQRKAAMLDDWYSWAGSNQKATDEQAQQAYKRIVQEYALIDFSRLALVKRQPSFLVGGRAAPDMDATEAATVKAFQSGQIDEAEFKRQAQLLNEWRDAYHATQQHQQAK